MTATARWTTRARRSAARTLFALAAGCGSASEPGLLDPGPGAPPPPAPPPPPASGVTYRFGAKFEPPVGRVVHALGQWESYNAKYAALLPASKQPAAELVFLDLGDTPRPWEPEKLAERFAQIAAMGRIPSLDLSLRGLQPGPDSLAKLPDPLYGIDHLVASTAQFDGRIQDVIAVAKAFRKPVMMRIGGEFSGWWNGYHPYEYPKAFRKIVGMFRQAGAHNVAFVWCYEPAAPGDFDAVNPSGQPKWFPGDDVVDWFSIDLFAAGDVSPVTGHGGAPGAYGRTIKFLDMAVAHQKPVVIAESAPSHYDLTSASQADAAWDEWFTPYFGLIAARPEILWFHYINYDWTKASSYASYGWKNNDLSASPTLAQRYAAEVARPQYLHAGEQHLLKDYLLYP